MGTHRGLWNRRTLRRVSASSSRLCVLCGRHRPEPDRDVCARCADANAAALAPFLEPSTPADIPRCPFPPTNTGGTPETRQEATSMANSPTSTLEHRPRLAGAPDLDFLVDLDQVVDTLVDYVRARAHAAGARSWANLVDSDHPDHRTAHRRANEAAEVAGAQLHILGMTLYPAVDDALAHEQFVDDIDEAIATGWAAGLRGDEATAHGPDSHDVIGFDDDRDHVDIAAAERVDVRRDLL